MISRRSIAGLAAACALLVAPAAAVAAGPPLVGGYGAWPLTKLGAGDLLLPVQGERGAAVVRFRLPAGARQGGRTWYRARVHCRVRLAPGKTAGLAYVTAYANGRASVQIKVERSRTGRVTWSTVDLIRGRTERSASGRSFVIDDDNYLQYRGVRPGLNVLAFTVERFGLPIESLTILGDSGLEVGRLAPAHLELEPALGNTVARAGQEFAVSFRVRNTGGIPARGVAIFAQPSSPVLRAVGRSRIRFGRLDRTGVGTFRFRATRKGRYRLELGAVATNANEPSVDIDVPVVSPVSRASERTARPVSLAAGVLFLVGAMSVAGLSRRRSG